jgi:hypothetical protein
MHTAAATPPTAAAYEGRLHDLYWGDAGISVRSTSSRPTAMDMLGGSRTARRMSAFDAAAHGKDGQREQDGLGETARHLGVGAPGGEVLAAGGERTAICRTSRTVDAQQVRW